MRSVTWSRVYSESPPQQVDDDQHRHRVGVEGEARVDLQVVERDGAVVAPVVADRADAAR